MANKRQGPRQPLSQRRPKAATNRALAKLADATRGTARAGSKRPGDSRDSSSKPASRAKSARRSPHPSRPAEIYTHLAAAYPDAHCELEYRTPFELLVATILSAQCTDKRVNMVSPHVFARYPDAEALAAAKQEELEEIIKSTGFFRSKAKSLIGMARALVERHGGEVPASMDDLVKLPGVGRKTANVILGNAFGMSEGVVVDTHVTRLSGRLGFTTANDPVKIEQDLVQLFPRQQWTMLSHLLVWHGRRVCEARSPKCEICVVRALCPSARV